MNALRKTTPGIMNDRDSLFRVICPNGTVESYTQYNHEMTGHSPGENLPDDVKSEWRYSGNAYWIEMELTKRGYKVEGIDDR